nr:hypothetical protein [Desulfobacula sp.]
MIIKKPNLSLEDTKKIHRYLLAGNSYKSAGEIFGLNYQIIKTALKAHHLEIKEIHKNRTAMSDRDIERAVKLLQGGMSQQKVIKEIRVNLKTLKRALGIKDIKIDPQWSKDKITREQKALAVKLFRNGLTYDQVGKKIGVSKNSLHYHFFKIDRTKPRIDFKPTKNETDELIRLLKNGQDKQTIADRLNTTVFFISLMIVESGVDAYFKRPKFKRGHHGLTEAKIREFIRLKFKGGISVSIVKTLGTTKPTLYRMLSSIEAEFIKGLSAPSLAPP